jgi:hypothetical protein
VSRRSGSTVSADAPGPAPGSPAAELAAKPGLRIRPYRPMRALVGAMIVIASVVAALAIYTQIGDRREVLAVRDGVLAGERITDENLQVVSISSDDSFPSISATNRALVVGQYAKVRLAAGALLVTDAIQPEELVNPERVRVSVQVTAGLVPVGLREQTRVTLVVTPPLSGAERQPPVLVEAVVLFVPRNLAEIVGSSGTEHDMVPLTVEIEPQWVSLVGTAGTVSVGVLDGQAPFPDPASQLGVGAVGDVFGDVYGATTLPAPVTSVVASGSVDSVPATEPEGTTG